MNPIHILVQAFNRVVDVKVTDGLHWREFAKIAAARAQQLSTSTTLIHAVHYLRDQTLALA